MNYWAWGGKYIGKRSGDTLYSSNGKPIGKFYSDGLYDFSGRYIGEIRNKNRIIVNCSSRSKRHSVSGKPCDHCGISYCDYVGYVMYAGYEDFRGE